jgi:HD-GYP domain-containing protein (c-di-GMP phosphodiesterase class II)
VAHLVDESRSKRGSDGSRPPRHPELRVDTGHLRGIAAEIIHSHHEHWDGSGYPAGLRGLEIPIAARIFSVVDSFDAITNDRPYRAAQPIEHALDEIERNAGTQFDPDIAQAFLRFMRDTQQQTRRAA